MGWITENGRHIFINDGNSGSGGGGGGGGRKTVTAVTHSGSTGLPSSNKGGYWIHHSDGSKKYASSAASAKRYLGTVKDPHGFAKGFTKGHTGSLPSLGARYSK